MGGASQFHAVMKYLLQTINKQVPRHLDQLRKAAKFFMCRDQSTAFHSLIFNLRIEVYLAFLKNCRFFSFTNKPKLPGTSLHRLQKAFLRVVLIICECEKNIHQQTFVSQNHPCLPNKGENLLVVSPLCQWKKISLAKLCKCTKKLTSSPRKLVHIWAIE